MTPSSSDLHIEYATHGRVRQTIDWIRYTLEGISVEFDGWDDEYISGPGLYFAIVSGRSVAEYADPMGENRWPVDRCPTIEPGIDGFRETAGTVARTRDGGVVVGVDGAVLERMVRFRDPEPGTVEIPADYADWMGSRHMSALDTSARPEVVATITLSGEDGRVTVFRGGTYETTLREELGGRWRIADEDGE